MKVLIDPGHSPGSVNGGRNECFHSVTYPNDKITAAKLTAAVSAVMGNPDRGPKTRAGNDGKDCYGVIRAAVDAGRPQAFLIENGFHDNERDEAFLLVDENLKRIAQAQAHVILESLAFGTYGCGGKIGGNYDPE